MIGSALAVAAAIDTIVGGVKAIAAFCAQNHCVEGGA